MYSATRTTTTTAAALEKHRQQVSLISRYAVDTTAGCAASFLVSPSITILDRAITQSASGARKVSESIMEGVKEMVMKPHVFLRRPEFVMIWGVYAVTYIAANGIITTCERSQVDNRWPKFIGTSLVNVTTCVLKDREFARMFGTVKPKPVPASTYFLFTMRDSMTVGASFNLPDPVSTYLQERMGLSKRAADYTAQITCPAGIQILSTPLNLLGLDLYNNPNNKVAARAKFIVSQYKSAMTMRVSRTLPAFGVGGVSNIEIRNFLNSLLDS